MSRKTVDLDSLIAFTNGFLSADNGNDTDGDVALRNGAISVLEFALRAADRYRGYSYLDQSQVSRSKPGIRWTDDGHSWVDTDSSRRRYA